MPYEVTGVYGLKPPTSAGFPASDSELTLGDWGDQPENIRRVWGTFALDDLKGYIRLDKVLAGPASLRSISRSLEEETETNGHEVDHPSNDRPAIAFSDTWGHRFRSGDVLVCSWRGATIEEVQRGKEALIDADDNERRRINAGNLPGPSQASLQSLPAPTSASVSTFGQRAPLHIRYLQGECRITLKEFNDVEVTWTRDGEQKQYQGQRIMGRLVEVISKRPLELEDGNGCTLEDFRYR